MAELINPHTWLTPEGRKQLILGLKDAVKKLMPYVHRKEIQYLSESQAEVKQICDILEMIFLHGIRLNEFHGQIVLWGLLERLEVLEPPCIPLRNSVGAIACVPSLRTPLGKARGWIRQSLNSQSLEDSLLFIASQLHNWTIKFYQPDALLCQKEEVNMFIAVIRSLKIFSFNLVVDNDSLNVPSAPINRIVQMQSASGPFSSPSAKSLSSSTKSPSNAATPSTTTESSTLDSFFRSFETGLDKILHQVDNLLNATYEGEWSEAGGVKKMVPLFGSNLKDLLLDDRRCAHANLNPELGIPTQIMKLIQSIHHQAKTPNLFRQRVSVHSIEELKKSLEAEKGIPPHCTVATTSFVLVQWLNQLPEPLFGFSHYSAILSCAEVEDVHHRIRNLSLLVAETSWYNKPLLLMVLSLLRHCLLPENASQNNLNPIAVAVLCTPFLLRPPYDKTQYFLSQEDIDRAHMAATASGSHLVEFMLEHFEDVSLPVKEELAMKQIILSNKCLKIRQLQEQLALVFDVNEVGSFDAEKLQLIYHLWNLLLPVERSLSFNTSAPSSPVPGSDEGKDDLSSEVPQSVGLTKQGLVSVEEILSHNRWLVCGLKREGEELPLMEFNTSLGWIALQSFVTFLKKYEVRATNMIVEFQLNRQKYCRLSQVILRIAHFTADVLYLYPPSSHLKKTTSIAPIQYISKTAAWPLFNEERVFQEIFDIAFLCFDESWRNITERIGEMPNQETFSQSLFRTRAILWEIIAKRPLTSQQIWEYWTAMRLAEEEKLFEMISQKSAKLASRRNSGEHSGYILKHGGIHTLSPNKPSPAPASSVFTSPVSSAVVPTVPSSSSVAVMTKQPPSTTSRQSSLPLDEDDDDDDDFNDFDNPEDYLPLKAKPSAASSSSAIPTLSFSSFFSGISNSMTGRSSSVSSSAAQKNQAIIEDISKALDSSSSDNDSDDQQTSKRNRSLHSRPQLAKGEPVIVSSITESPSSNKDVTIAGPTTNKTDYQTPPQMTASSSSKTAVSGKVDTAMSSGSDKVPRISSLIRDLEVNDNIVDHTQTISASLRVPTLNTQSAAMRHYHLTGEMSDYMNASMASDAMKAELAVVWRKTCLGISTNIYGGSKILTMDHIEQIEGILPATHQCYDWKLLYRLSLHGASLSTLLNKAQGYNNTLLVVQDAQGAIFGALITEALRFAEKDKYYGNGTIGVWSFNSGKLKYFPWSYKNSYFMISSKDCLAFGGGGNFALYLDSDLNRGTSGPCQTFSSPCLATAEEFQCISCELFAFQATTGLH